MTRIAALALGLALFAAPAAAQVINGETPLDETQPNRETPRQATTSDRSTAATAPQPGAGGRGRAAPDSPRD